MIGLRRRDNLIRIETTFLDTEGANNLRWRYNSLQSMILWHKYADGLMGPVRVFDKKCYVL